MLGLGSPSAFRREVRMSLAEWDPRRGRQGRPWRRLVKELCPPGALCEVEECLYPHLNREIIFGLRPNHPYGPSLDHIVPLEEGGHPTSPLNLRPAHFGCNAGRPRRRQVRRAHRSRAAQVPSSSEASHRSRAADA